MENICDVILEYNMHKERAGSRRFAKGKSETMETLEGLRDRGVKVDLGIPEQVRSDCNTNGSGMTCSADFRCGTNRVLK